MLPTLPLLAEDAPPTEKAAESIEVPYRLTDTQHVLVRVKLNGKGPFNFIIDTGAPAVILNETIGQKLGLKPDRNGWANFDQFELEGGLKAEKTRGLVLDMFQLKGMNSMGLAGVELHGVIGYDVLARYRIQYDFTKDKLIFTPLKFSPPQLMRLGKGGQGSSLEAVGDMMKFLAPLLGMSPNFDRKPRGFWGVELDGTDKGVIVTMVFPNSPAEKAGLKKGDKIDLIQKLDIDNMKDVEKAISKLNAGQKVKLRVVREDEKVELTLQPGKGL